MLETKVLLLGVDSVGKTKLLYKLKLNEDIMTIPTIGFNVEAIAYKEKEITIWDLGGGDKIRALWKYYFEKMNCIIFVMDISNKSRMEEYKEAFNILLNQHKEFRDIPILIFGNKFNGKIEFEPEEFLQKVEVPPELSPSILKGDVLTGEGLTELLEYIYENIEFTKKEENNDNGDEVDNNNNNKEEINGEIKEKLSYKILMLGLDNTGKTEILYLLKLGEKVITLPTIGFNVETIENENWEKKITIWDIGGNEKIRVLWHHYLNDLKGLIWVYDTSKIDKLEESKNELKKVLTDINESLPLLIYANKNDLNDEIAKLDFINGIEEYLNKRPYCIQSCNHDDIESYKNGLEWLYNNIK